MRRLETLLVVLGFAFYIWLLKCLGLHTVAQYVRVVGLGLLLTIALEALARIANTLGWRIAVTQCPAELDFAHLFAARIAGEAIDYTTPSAQLGGQFVMALMVRRRLALAAGLASVVVAALAEAVGQIGFVLGALMLSARLAATVHKLFWPLVGGLSLTVTLAVGFYLIQVNRPFSRLWKVAAKLDLAAIATDAIARSSEVADRLLAEFYQRHKPRLLASCLCYLAAWSLGPLEIYLLLGFLHQPRTLEVVLLTEALGILIERATFMIPAKLVSQEGGKALILGLLGYPPSIGFAVGLLRRIKELFWVLAGLTIFGLYRWGERQAPAELGEIAARAPLAESAE
ncbi:MAG TPA: lysylphosphatidylglycerol synthase transmembrane domain-containing protein [Candidatus Binataceae bacterium]|nr:lysylphosphatidylglycerol synthase transmembrane domain-containing protein [Candidatus Binataceae bacterium]